MSDFSRRFKELREARGMTQDKIAEILGISRSTVAGYESEDKSRIPREETLTKIADLFGTSIDYLLGRTNDNSGSIMNETDSNKRPGERLKEYIEQGLTNDQLKKRGDLYVTFLALNDEQTEEFLNFARDQIFKNLKQPSAAASKSQEQ